MAAKPPHALLIDCPPSRQDDGGDGRQDRLAWRNSLLSPRACMVAALVLAVAAFATGLTFLLIFVDRKFPSKGPVYTVAITGVSGLDVLYPPPVPSLSPSPAAADAGHGNSPPPTLSSATPSPVFNLTFQIDNTRNAQHEACVPGLSKVDVSYGDAYLAGGSAPPFCAGKMRSSGPVAARAWGENVAVPKFLGGQLAAELAAGDASVDVKVTMPSPRYCRDGWCNAGSVLSCKPKIGDGTYAACRLDYL